MRAKQQKGEKQKQVRAGTHLSSLPKSQLSRPIPCGVWCEWASTIRIGEWELASTFPGDVHYSVHQPPPGEATSGSGRGGEEE